MRAPPVLAAPLLTLVLVTLLAGSLASAQEATPAALPAIPDPRECTVEPRPLAFFARFVGTAPTTLAALATETPYAEPQGEPAPPEVAAAVTAVMRQEVACFNGGDWLRRAALWTDERLLRAIAHNARYFNRGVTAEEVAFLAGTPIPVPAEEHVELLGVVVVEVLPDGRVVALVGIEACCYQVPGRRTYLAIFAKHGNQWRIDEFLLWGKTFGTPEPEGGKNVLADTP